MQNIDFSKWNKPDIYLRPLKCLAFPPPCQDTPDLGLYKYRSKVFRTPEEHLPKLNPRTTTKLRTTREFTGFPRQRTINLLVRALQSTEFHFWRSEKAGEKLRDQKTTFNLGVTSPFFPGSFFLGKWLLFEKNDGCKEWKRNQPLEWLMFGNNTTPPHIWRYFVYIYIYTGTPTGQPSITRG